MYIYLIGKSKISAHAWTYLERFSLRNNVKRKAWKVGLARNFATYIQRMLKAGLRSGLVWLRNSRKVTAAVMVVCLLGWHIIIWGVGGGPKSNCKLQASSDAHVLLLWGLCLCLCLCLSHRLSSNLFMNLSKHATFRPTSLHFFSLLSTSHIQTTSLWFHQPECYNSYVHACPTFDQHIVPSFLPHLNCTYSTTPWNDWSLGNGQGSLWNV